MVYSDRSSMAWLLAFLVAMITIQAGTASWYTYVDRVERAVPTEPPENHLTENVTEFSHEVDNHQYYEVAYRDHDPNLWMDVDTLGEPLQINDRLSNSQRHAVRVGLDFTFPFYGYDTSSLHITSSGFLYVGSYPHRLLAETQYVAPLMADFSPRVDNKSEVSYFKNDTLFVAEWKNVHLESDTDKNFTFQAVIYKNGTLMFSYKELQMSVVDLAAGASGLSNHPVKVGLADAYYVDTTILIFTRRTIFQYHAVEIDFERVQPMTSIILTPLETCTARTTCSGCTTETPVGFNCTWCQAAQKCSDGFDRHRPTWTNSGCFQKNTTTCPAPTPTQATQGSSTTVTPLTPKATRITETAPQDPEMVPSEELPGGTTPSPHSTSEEAPPEDLCPQLDCGPGSCEKNKCICPDGYYGGACQSKNASKQKGNASSSSAGLVVFFLVLIITISVVAGWAFYAYRNPTTDSGLTLIRITRCYYCKGSKEAGGTYKYSRASENI